MNAVFEDEPAMSATRAEALAMTLREAADRYAAGCSFKPGDLVTPRRGHNTRGAGIAHIVLEVFASPIQRFTDDPLNVTHLSNGARLDMRVATESRGVITAYAVESWEYETWSPPAETDR